MSIGPVWLNSVIWEDPIYGQGYYEKEKVESRYEFKRQILRGHAESLGFVIV